MFLNANLSLGGNQQGCLVCLWLHINPDIDTIEIGSRRPSKEEEGASLVQCRIAYSSIEIEELVPPFQ
jgi:hypothetical protein